MGTNRMTPTEITTRLSAAYEKWREESPLEGPEQRPFDRAFLQVMGFLDLHAVAENNRAYFDQIAWKHPTARYAWTDRYGRRQEWQTRRHLPTRNRREVDDGREKTLD